MNPRQRRSLRRLVKTGLFCWAVFYFAAAGLLGPQAVSLAEHDLRRAALEAIHESVREELPGGKLVRVTCKKDGSIASVQSDAPALAAMQTAVSRAIHEKLAARRTVRIHAGSLTRWPVLSGKGPPVFLWLEPHGTAQVRFHHSFSSAGVNQTLYSLRMDVTVQVTVHALWYASVQEVSASFVAGETVIVGEAPGTMYGMRGTS